VHEVFITPNLENFITIGIMLLVLLGVSHMIVQLFFALTGVESPLFSFSGSIG
jgi:hypothetical protein